MEQRPLHVNPAPHAIAEQVDGPVMHGPGDVVIACSVGEYPKPGIPDPNRGLLRKLADAILDFIGYHRAGEPSRNRQWD